MWAPKGQQVMIPTPMQPTRRYGLGAVNWHTGETVVLTRQHKRRREIAEVLEALLRGAAGRLILLYLPTYSPWLNPIEMLWRHFRREVTHCELFDNIEAMLEATRDFFDRINRNPGGARSIIGAHST
jgi:DDE superfamily endonuclease